MPRYPKSKFQLLSPSKQQAMQKAGVEVYDDSGAAGGSESTTHEAAYGDHATTLDHSPAKDPRYKNKLAELRATGGREKMQRGHSSLMWDKGHSTLAEDLAYTPTRQVTGVSFATGKPYTKTVPMVPSLPEEQAQGRRRVARTVGAVGGAMLGGPPGAAAGGVAGSLLGQAGGVFLGDLLGQAATTDAGDVSVTESGVAAGVDLATGGAMHGAGFLLGRAGGVSREAIKQGALRPKEILKAPVRDEYYDLAQDIGRDAQRRMDPRFYKTEPRRKLESLYAAHGQSGQTVDGLAVVDSLDHQIRGLANPQDHTIDKTLEAFRDRLLDRLGKMSPSGQITAMQMDQLIREEMGSGLKKFYETLGGSAYIKRVARARGEAAGSLYSQVDPSGGAKALGKEANRQLKVTERVAKLVPLGTEVKEITSSPQALRAAMNPANVGKGVALERAFKSYDKLHGTGYYRRMNDLSLREQWSPLERQEATELVGFVLATGYRARGPLARMSARAGKVALRQGVPAVARRALLGEAATMLVPSHEPTQ